MNQRCEKLVFGYGPVIGSTRPGTTGPNTFTFYDSALSFGFLQDGCLGKRDWTCIVQDGPKNLHSPGAKAVDDRCTEVSTNQDSNLISCVQAEEVRCQE